MSANFTEEKQVGLTRVTSEPCSPSFCGHSSAGEKDYGCWTLMKISENINRSFWIQVSLASLTGILLAVTLISREWIELVFGFDPRRQRSPRMGGRGSAFFLAGCIPSACPLRVR